MTTITREQLPEVVHTLRANAPSGQRAERALRRAFQPDARRKRGVLQIRKHADLGFILQQTQRNLPELATLP